MKVPTGVYFNWLLFIKTLHGLKQTGESWNLLLKGALLSYGFIRISEDYCLLIYQYGGKMTIYTSMITIWADKKVLFTKFIEI